MPLRDPALERRWREIIANWQASEISIAEFCRLNDINYKTFCNWRQRIRDRDLKSAHAHSTNNKTRKRRAVLATRNANQMSGTAQRADTSAESSRKVRSVEFAEVKVVDQADLDNTK